MAYPTVVQRGPIRSSCRCMSLSQSPLSPSRVRMPLPGVRCSYLWLSCPVFALPGWLSLSVGLLPVSGIRPLLLFSVRCPCLVVLVRSLLSLSVCLSGSAIQCPGSAVRCPCLVSAVLVRYLLSLSSCPGSGHRIPDHTGLVWLSLSGVRGLCPVVRCLFLVVLVRCPLSWSLSGSAIQCRCMSPATAQV